MIRSLFVKAVFAFSLVQCALLFSACSSVEHAEASSRTGVFSMPLRATAGGHSYRLQGTLYVYGPTFQQLDLNVDSSAITTNLPTGSYFANLNNWALTRDDGSGKFLPVSATLASSSTPSFSIFNQATTTVSFQFETDGQIVTVGAGQLNVAIGVHEASLVCTPLGDDCPLETWCAPTELTGAPLKCIPAGPVAWGASCSGPNDCATNSSCFDFGAGAVCLQLCTSAQFNQPCSADDLCTPSGSGYGVCRPNPAAGGGAAGETGK